MLCGTSFLDESHSAMHLYTEIGDYLGGLGAPPFDDWHHELRECLMLSSHPGVRIVACVVECRGGDVCSRTHCLGERAHSHKHAPDIRVFYNCLLYTSPSPRDRQNLVCRLLLA